MGDRRYAATEADLPRGTLAALFLEAVDRFGGAVAFRTRSGGEWIDTSYEEAGELAFAVAAAFGVAGLRKGDRAVLLSDNRVEWALTDYGALLAGVQIVPVYATLTAADIRYLVNDSEARAAVVSDRTQLDKILEIRAACPHLERIVAFDAPGDDMVGGGDARDDAAGDARGDAGGNVPGDASGDDALDERGAGVPLNSVISWEMFLESGRGAAWKPIRDAALAIAPDDVATMLYTSGTTGTPKGVMLTHDNLFSNVAAVRSIVTIGPDDRSLSILPLSHVLQRMVDYIFFDRGCSIAYPHSRETIPEDMRSARPTVMVAVPRVYEKVYNRVIEATGLRGRLVRWARGVGSRWASRTLAGRQTGPLLRLEYALADRLVFRKIREGVGGAIRFFVSGGGPLSHEINRFFYSVGLTILEGYGLTETSPVTNVNTERDFRIGTVGKPVPGTEIRIGERDEILVRGRQVMKGYFMMPEATREAIAEDGWFHTGDVGRLDEDGFLTVTDRLKDLIITSGGKNVAPQPIENLLKENRFVEQAVMVGDGRKFPSILVVPSFANVGTWARERGIVFDDFRDLLGDERVRKLLHDEIYGAFRDLSRYELPKKVGLLTEELTIEDGSLTPTEKIKRRVVEERYRTLIDRFYTDEAVEQTLFVADDDASAKRARAS